MSDPRPIGIFDSGLGGLTVAKEIFKELPWESTIYIGDTARVPYGNRSVETITGFSRQLIKSLLAQNVKAIVIACATASSVALHELQQEFVNVPIFGVIMPAAEAALKSTKTGNIGVVGTRGTINSRSFENAIETISKLHPKKAPVSRFDAIITHSKSCPLFVPIIEEGFVDGAILSEAINYYLHDTLTQQVDTLILGCTHYPLIAEKIQTYLPKVTLINVGIPLANTLKQDLSLLKLLNTHKNIPSHVFFATDVTDNFIRIANLFLGTPLDIEPLNLI